jgi:proline iminopeptidase
MERMVKDFEEVRKALRIERWITMGHSFGGILQMGYVMRVPEACRGMIMINCTLDFNDTASTWIPKACEFLGITNTAPYMDRSKPIEERLPILMQKLKEKDLFWRMGYASKESENLMNATFADIPHWNHDLERMFARFPEYFQDYRTGAPAVKVPVLFFYGRTDWMVGPEHYKGVHFPHMLLWGSDVGHIPFIENKADLEKAIIEYITYDRQ